MTRCSKAKNKLQGKNIKMYIQFDDPGTVISKVAISSVSAEGALKNLDAEVPDFDFKKVVKATKLAWNEELNQKYRLKAARQISQQQREANSVYNPYGTTRPVAKGKKEEIPDYAKEKQIIFYSALIPLHGCAKHL
jgi:putative alpha-1,2-mannosidase